MPRYQMKRWIRPIVVGGLAALIGGACNREPQKTPTNTEATASPPQTAQAAEPGAQTQTAPNIQAPVLPDPIILADVGFDVPGSVIVDEVNDRYLVSNVSIDAEDDDNNGFISWVTPEGKVENLRWIEGGKNGVALGSPKGMAIRSKTLYVTDKNTVRKFDLTSGAPQGEIPIEGATFLNDIDLGPNGTLYVTDTGYTGVPRSSESSGSDAIHEIDSNDKVTTLVKHQELAKPNGVLAAADGVYFVSFVNQELGFVSHDGKLQRKVKLPGGRPDGIIKKPDGTLLISSWNTSTVYQGKPDGPFTALLVGMSSPGDISYDAKRDRVLVPFYKDNILRIQPLGEVAAANN